jgi:LuxR family maltose regulon positive regulatory protein
MGMMAPMTEAKVRPPLARQELLVRPRLIAGMQDAAAAPLVLVTGVAGVGKTTLVRQWLSCLEGSTAVAWMTVDARDNDPVRFWRYLAAASP